MTVTIRDRPRRARDCAWPMASATRPARVIELDDEEGA
jgi:hypothetical protein